MGIDKADLVLKGGKIFSPDVGRPELKGVAIAGGRIAAVGRDEELEGLVGPQTTVIDLEGRRALPGFNDAHIHFTDGGYSLREVDCRGARSALELAERAQARARALGPGRWVTGRGWDHRAFPEGAWPTREALDRLCSANPVLLRRVCGHAALANAPALAAAAIGQGSGDPPGGRIGRDARTGDPDGLLFETAVDEVRAAIPPPTRAERLEGLRLALARAREVGLTSVQDERGDLDHYLELERAGELSVRVSLWNRIYTPLAELEAWRASFPPGHERLRPGLLKGYLDGSLGARTALFFEPYVDDPRTCGVEVLAPADLEALAVPADAAGFQIGLHAIGDRANAVALDCFAACRTRNGTEGRRHRVEHAQVVRLEDIPRFADLGVVASMQPSHCVSDLAFAGERLGPRRLVGAYAWRKMLHAGAKVAFGSDFPVEPMDPLLGLYAAVTREAVGGGPAGGWYPEERLSLAEAIDLFTRGSAYAERQEGAKGSLAPGQLADVVVFAEDLFALSAYSYLDVKVDLTIVGGEVVYRRE